MFDVKEIPEQGPDDVVPRVVLPKVAVPIPKEPACLCGHLEHMGRGAPEVDQNLAQIRPLNQAVEVVKGLPSGYTSREGRNAGVAVPTKVIYPPEKIMVFLGEVSHLSCSPVRILPAKGRPGCQITLNARSEP